MKYQRPSFGRICFTALALSAALASNSCITNKNLQPAEAAGTQGGGFDLADANHDGKLTRKEWMGGEPSRAADFKKRDANHDGIVTREEAIKYGRAHGIANKIMAEADKNHDGKLSRKEVQDYYASREGPPR